ncbi:GntR family transcriptional regulator [Rubrivivax sp. RP6-9]|uniref:GntR family transcriptional regulator n=1 Tax=Rubrivivax sp. RP6-9 TaxID=3415750 RepID=UPI003CC503DE
MAAADDDTIHAVISDALLAGRLAPGAPLRELALAEVFGVSRERVRKVLQRLGTERLLLLVPNRGAFVAEPTLEQARALYEARRILEGGIVGHLAPLLGAADGERLRAHLRTEAAAMERGDRAEAVRLSAEFHYLLARAAGSDFVEQALRQLVSRTSMLVALFEPARSMRCACEEHAEIAAALLAGNGAEAMKAMHRHLALVETRLRPSSDIASGDPVDVLRADWKARQKAARAARR